MTSAVDWSLQQLQTWFLHVTTHPGSLEQGIAAQTPRLPARELARVIRTRAGRAQLEGLEIYHHGYVSRLIECLADDFPGIRTAVGEPRFDDLCRRYIAAHPSHGPSLNIYGRAFADFLRTVPVKSAGLLAELAQLEWSLVECLHAPAHDAAVALELADVHPQRLPALSFVVSQALRVLSFTYPVNAFLQAVYDARTPPLPEPCHTHVAVVRQAQTLWRFDLSDAQAELLKRLMWGQPLGHALRGIEVRPADIQVWFGDWTHHGFFSVIRADHQRPPCSLDH